MQYLKTSLLAVVASVLSSGPANADFGDQLFKLIPDDGPAGTLFGGSVATNGSTAIIGASHGGDNGSGSGSAYLFDNDTGQQLFKLLADDGAESDAFGISVAINSTTAIAAARNDDEFMGSVYLFDIATGEQIIKVVAEDGAANDWFGSSVAMNENVAIVGAPRDDDKGIDSGSAYLYDISDPMKPIQIAKLLAEDGADGDLFGGRVAISGAIAIVSAWRDDDNGISSGSAYLFDTSTGEQLFKLVPDDGEALDYFGISVAISGDIALIGASGDDDDGVESGSAYLFNTTTGKQISKLQPEDGSQDSNFGNSVAMSSNPQDKVVAIGAQFDSPIYLFSGSAYFFNPTTGQQMAKLIPDEGTEGETFGHSLAIDSNSLIVGGSGSSSAYVFDAAATPGKCPWDLDKSGSVGTGDLLELFTQWGTDGSADFDESGEVGTGDLLILFANWGPCK